MKNTGPNTKNFVSQALSAFRGKDFVAFKEGISNILHLKAKSRLFEMKDKESKNY